MKLSARPELDGQTALRGVAALAVFIAHAAYLDLFPGNRLLARIYQIFFWHNEAVDLFFELSGFILCYVYADRAFRWRDYFVARFARIYPVYLAALLFMLVLLYYGYKMGRGVDGFTAYGIFSNALLFQDWPLLPYVHSANFPTWSISVEIFLYIAVFPCLYLLNHRLNLWSKWALAIFPVVLSVAVICATWGVGNHGVDAKWDRFDPYRGILCFTSGFFVCSLGLQTGFPRILSFWGELIFLLVTASALLFQFPFNHKVAILCFPLLAYLSAQGGSLLARVFSGKFFAWLGHISYSVYVWHWPVLHFCTMALNKIFLVTHRGWLGSPLLLVVVSIAAVFSVSHFSHFHFERPIGAWLRRKLAPGIPPVAVALK